MARIKLVKTLPHLIPLFLKNEGGFVYSNVYSQDTLEFLEDLKPFKNLSFTNIRKFLERTAVNSQDTSLEQEAFPIFSRVEQVTEKLDYTIKGDIVSFWPIGYEHPIRIEFFGEDIEQIYLFDELYGRKIESLKEILLSEVILEDKTERESIKIQIPNEEIQNELQKYVFVNSLRDINPVGFDVINTDFTLPPLFYSKINIFENEVTRLKNLGYDVIIKSEIYKRNDETKDLKSNNEESGIKFKSDVNRHEILERAIEMPILAAGFISPLEKIAVFTDREIYGTIFLTRPEN